jgi:hypothetical protein
MTLEYKGYKGHACQCIQLNDMRIMMHPVLRWPSGIAASSYVIPRDAVDVSNASHGSSNSIDRPRLDPMSERTKNACYLLQSQASMVSPLVDDTCGNQELRKS